MAQQLTEDSCTSGAGTAREWEGEEGEGEVTEPTGLRRSSGSHIGVTGLAVMGANLARNIARRGTPTAVHNRTTAKTTEFI